MAALVKQPTWEGYQADVAKPNSKTKSNFTGFIRYLTEFNSNFYACGQAMGGFDTSGITDGIPVDPYDDFCKADIIDDKSILLAQEVSASLKGVKQTSTGDTCVITKPNIESTVVINTDKMAIVNMNKKNFMTVHGDGDGCKTKKAGEFSSADKFMETLFEKKTDIDYIGGDLNLTTLKTGLEPDAIGILINNYLDENYCGVNEQFITIMSNIIINKTRQGIIRNGQSDKADVEVSERDGMVLCIKYPGGVDLASKVASLNLPSHYVVYGSKKVLQAATETPARVVMVPVFGNMDVGPDHNVLRVNHNDFKIVVRNFGDILTTDEKKAWKKHLLGKVLNAKIIAEDDTLFFDLFGQTYSDAKTEHNDKSSAMKFSKIMMTKELFDEYLPKIDSHINNIKPDIDAAKKAWDMEAAAAAAAVAVGSARPGTISAMIAQYKNMPYTPIHKGGKRTRRKRNRKTRRRRSRNGRR